MSENKSMIEYLKTDSVESNIQMVLREKTPQFIASVTSLVSSNPTLAKTEQTSILKACLIAATLDLPINPNLGFAYIIPYKTGDYYIAQFQMGYKGFIQLAQRSSQFKTINATDIKEGEISRVDIMTGEFVWSDEFLNADLEYLETRKKKQTVGYIAYMKLLNGFEKMLYMSNDDLTKHATKFSQSFKNKSSKVNMWRDDFDKMSKKTVLKLMISKYAPMNTDMQKAIESDQAVVTESGLSYPDNQPVSDESLADEKEHDRIVKYIDSAKTIEDLEKCRGAVDEAPGEDLVELFINKEKELGKK